MTLLGQFCLWIALLIGTWGAVVGFSGRWQGRPALAEAVTRYAAELEKHAAANHAVTAADGEPAGQAA